MEPKVLKTRIFGLGKPPTFEYPYLDPFHHRKIIESFKADKTALHYINIRGEVDFFILLPQEDIFDGILAVKEDLSLTLQADRTVNLVIDYSGLDMMESLSFAFNLNHDMDRYCMEWLSRYELISLYYMVYTAEEYVCVGLKTLCLPFALWYDLSRYLAFKGPLRVPKMLAEEISDQHLTGKLLISPAMGFYINFSELIRRFGEEPLAEEIFYRHFLHGLSRIQMTRRREIREQSVYVWINRQIVLNLHDQPDVIYGVFLLIQQHFDKHLDALYSLFSVSFNELPEFMGTKVVFPLEEEGIPVIVIEKGTVERIHLTREFFLRAKGVFLDRYMKQENYKSCYERFMDVSQKKDAQNKVVDLTRAEPKRWRLWD
jgi:hypothetical protein